MTNTDDIVQGFQLEQTGLRGRIVRIGPALDAILAAHAYPDGVATLTAEMTTLSLLLSALIKYEGVFTLQAQGDGPLRMIVADVARQSGGQSDIRACATFNKEQIDIHAGISSPVLFGKGYVAFTVDQGEYTERYQGIVQLQGKSLVDSVQHYFSQSEQIGTGIRMAVSRTPQGWRGGAIIVQEMPDEGGKALHDPAHMAEDDWRRTMVLLQSCTDDELVDPALTAPDLLFRLFHEEGVRVFDPVPVCKGCRCSEEKVMTVLTGIRQEELAEVAEQGKIDMTCEFCNRTFTFALEQIAANRRNKNDSDSAVS